MCAQVTTTWASYYGPESGGLHGLKEDDEGNLYGFIITDGSPFNLSEYMNTFITDGAFDSYHQENNTGNSLFFKLSPQGNVLWSSFFPGTIVDLSLSGDGSIYLCGSVSNTEIIASENAAFPNRNEFGDDIYTQLDGFLAKFDSNGQKLWGTYLPEAFSLEADDVGNVYVSGKTFLPQIFGSDGSFGQDFVFIYDEQHWNPNTYLLKVNPQGQLLWSTYYGFCSILDIAVNNNEIYIAGGANSISELNYFATEGAFLSGLTSGMFLSKFNSEGERLWSTYYGNSSVFDNRDKIKILPNNKIIIAGYTSSTSNIATQGVYRENIAGNHDYFLAQFDTNGNRDWGTYYGGSGAGDEFPVNNLNIMDASDDLIYVGGCTTSTSGVATEHGINPNINNSNFYDAFINIFDHNGNRLWGSYYGGSKWEFGSGILLSNNHHNFFLYGMTQSQSGVSTPQGAHPVFSHSPFTNPSSASNGYIVKFDTGSLGLPSSHETNDIRFYPNPNNGNFTLTGTALGTECFQMQIFDVLGRQLITKKLELYEHLNFDYSASLESGTFILKLTSENQKNQRIFKFVVR